MRLRFGKNNRPLHITAQILSVLLLTGRAMAVEEPKYEVLQKAAEYEVRRYPPVVVAELKVDESFGDAGNVAFRPLAEFIGGANSGSEKIEMTAPVMQQPTRGETISMTAPVMQRSSGKGRYAIQFVMPEGYTLATVPRPTDGRIKLREEAGRVVAVHRYSGTWSETRYRSRLASLQRALARDGLTASGEPVWARYNSPFTLWFLRRNEIWQPVDWNR